MRLLDGPESWWLHEIRQGLRLAEWRKAGNRRNDMRSIESTAGIDKLATTKAMNSTKILTEQRYDLRELHCGCVPFFVMTNLTMKSTILWRCPRWETLRFERQAPSNRDRLTWPPRTSRCGIFLEDPESVAWADMGPKCNVDNRSVATPCQTMSCQT